MNRERAVRAALHAFPVSVRVAHGEEMLGTLLDVSATSHTRFALELIGLVRSGMQTRATQTARAGARRVVADGVCLAAAWLLMLFLAGDLGERIRGPIPGYDSDLLSPWSLALLGAALALALVGYDRLAGAAALLFVASVVADPAWRDLTDSRRELMLVPVICFSVLLLAPRRRTPDARRLAWLALTAALAVASSTNDDPDAAILIVGLLVLVPLAITLLRTDPRPAIACALPVTSFGIHMAQDRGGPGVPGVLFLLAAPLILTVAVTRTRHLQARDTL